MPASSAPRTPLLLQLSNSIGCLGSRIGGWRRAPFAVALVVVAFSIVGMHQLSLEHELVTPSTPTSPAAVAAAAGHQDSGARDHETAEHITGPVSASLRAVEFASHGSMAFGTPDGTSGGPKDGCPGCGSHTMAFDACLLALTLLVLSWWLPPPVRRTPPQVRRRPARAVALTARRVPALSLAELSILRT